MQSGERMNLRKLVAIVFISLSAVAAQADTISYHFTSSLIDVSFTSPFIINTDTTIPASSFVTNNTPSITSLEISPNSAVCGYPPVPVFGESSCILFNEPTVGYGYYFSAPLTSLGIYVSGNAQLDISRVTDAPSAVPEPSSRVLLVTGLCGALALVSTKSKAFLELFGKINVRMS
jgi:hypothetical protein